jgi:hypothetical protein
LSLPSFLLRTQRNFAHLPDKRQGGVPRGCVLIPKFDFVRGQMAGLLDCAGIKQCGNLFNPALF